MPRKKSKVKGQKSKAKTSRRKSQSSSLYAGAIVAIVLFIALVVLLMSRQNPNLL